MSKVFFYMTMSLDGCSAPEFMQLDQPLDKWVPKWSELQAYAFDQRFLRENLKLGEGGETGSVNQFMIDTFERTGASIMGKRMFDGGEQSWPEDAPFHTPVYVLTHQVCAPWERPGGTTFYFINDGIESALRQARDAVGDKDVRIAGGATTVLQYLNTGLIDEFTIALSPVFLGKGQRLFDGVDDGKIGLRVVDTIEAPKVTHVTYAVTRK